MSEPTNMTTSPNVPNAIAATAPQTPMPAVQTAVETAENAMTTRESKTSVMDAMPITPQTYAPPVPLATAGHVAQDTNLRLLPIRSKDYLANGAIRFRVIARQYVSIGQGAARTFAYNAKVKYGLHSNAAITHEGNPYPSDEDGTPVTTASSESYWVKDVHIEA